MRTGSPSALPFNRIHRSGTDAKSQAGDLECRILPPALAPDGAKVA